MLGKLGDIVFEASSDLVRTWDEVSETVSVRLGTHEIAGGYPVTEFVGFGLRTRSFSVVLNASLGVDVEGDITKAYNHCEGADALDFVMGVRQLGGPGAKWVIEQCEATRSGWDRRGDCILATLSLTVRLAIQTPGQAPSLGIKPMAVTVPQSNTRALPRL